MRRSLGGVNGPSPAPKVGAEAKRHKSEAAGAPASYDAAMLRISWPLALLLAVAIALVARRPRMLLPLLIVFGIWFLVERARRRR